MKGHFRVPHGRGRGALVEFIAAHKSPRGFCGFPNALAQRPNREPVCWPLLQMPCDECRCDLYAFIVMVGTSLRTKWYSTQMADKANAATERRGCSTEDFVFRACTNKVGGAGAMWH